MTSISKELLITVTALVLFCSCVSTREQTKKSVYFKEISDSALNKAMVEYEPVFQKGDILSVTVVTANENSSRIFNQSTYTPGSSTADGQSTVMAGAGYLIDEEGSITFPFLGKIKAAGSTRAALTETISGKLRQYVDSAIVSIRLVNYRVTVLGEVAKPGTFSIPSERVSVLDAIGLAGDLTIYGRRDNIRVIRTIDGNRQTGTLNLNKGDIFSSPFYFLRQNDIVYVELNERKIPNSDQANLRTFSIAIGVVSALGVIISTINVLR